MISDGDLRRLMERHGYSLLDRSAAECMTRSPGPRRPPRARHPGPRPARDPEDHLAAGGGRDGTHRGRPAPPRPVEDGDDLNEGRGLAERCRAPQADPERRGRGDDGRDGPAAAGRRRGQGLPRPRRARRRAGPPRRTADRGDLRPHLRDGEPTRGRARHGGGAPGGAATRARSSAEILEKEGLEAREVAYIGDDVNDLPVLTEVGSRPPPPTPRWRSGSRPSW